MNRTTRVLPLLLGLLAVPHQASANAGTPLLWAGMIHLTVGNAVIGVVEGLLLGWWFGLPRARAIAVMIVANYASAWLGGVLIGGAIAGSLPTDLNSGWRWLWGMVGITYCLTLLLELPFVAWLFRATHGGLNRILRASLAIQSVSYLLLFGCYWMASDTSLYTQVKVVRASDLSLPQSVQIYYIDSSDGHIYQRGIRGSGNRKIMELHSADVNDRLFVRSSDANPDRWDLVARLETRDRRGPKVVPILTNMDVDAAPDWRTVRADPTKYPGTSVIFGSVSPLGSAATSPWEFRTGSYPVQGLRAARRATGENFHFSYETPFGAWAVRNAVHLPSDKVLFQLGANQICVFDPASRRVALLWRGRGPVPIIERHPPNPADQPTGSDRSDGAASRPNGRSTRVTEE